MRYVGSGINALACGRSDESPAASGTLEPPGPAAFAGHGDLNNASGPRRHVAVCVREAPHETLEHRAIQLRGHDTRTIDGKPNLLLVVPALGEFPGDIEPRD